MIFKTSSVSVGYPRRIDFENGNVRSRGKEEIAKMSFRGRFATHSSTSGVTKQSFRSISRSI